MRNQEEEKIELQEKVHRRICVRDLLFCLHVFLLMTFFVAFFMYSFSLAKWRTFITYILFNK